MKGARVRKAAKAGRPLFGGKPGHDRARGVSRIVRPQSDVGVDLHPGRHLRAHHVGEGQPRNSRAGRRRRDDSGRRARPGRRHPRHRLQHHRPAYRHDDSGVDLTPLRHVPVSGGEIGATRQGAPRRHLAHLAGHHRGAFGFSRQRHHGAAHRSGDARDLHHVESSSLSLSVRRNSRLQYRRHRDIDRRSAQHSDRLAGRTVLQRFRRRINAGHPDRDGGAGDHHPRLVGQGPAHHARM